MSGHTPGPWSVHPYYYEKDVDDLHLLVGLGPFDTVAEVRHGHADMSGSVEANARLIAAAPELLAALADAKQSLAVAIYGLPDMLERNALIDEEGMVPALQAAVDRMEAAIAKATEA